MSLSKREADLAIVLERPKRGQYVYTKLCEYRLKLYGTRDYLDRHAPVKSAADLQNHAFISYVNDLAFSHELLYLDRTIPNATANLCSTSVGCLYGVSFRKHRCERLRLFRIKRPSKEHCLARLFVSRPIQDLTRSWIYLSACQDSFGKRSFPKPYI